MNQFVIYDPERNLFVVILKNCDFGIGGEQIFMTANFDHGTRFTREQADEFLQNYSAQYPWLKDRAEIREIS